VSATGRRDKIATWHDGLLGYVGGDEARRDEAERRLSMQGREAGITFDFNVLTHWQPIDSQRLLMWAARFGKAEKYMHALNTRHFEQGASGESASSRKTILAAAAEAGLDVEAAAAFLDSEELKAEVWKSYGDTINKHGVHSIPLFVFNVAALGLVGGPFRSGGQGTPFVLNGSMDADTFLAVFNGALQRLQARRQELPLLGRRVVLSGLTKEELNGRCGIVKTFSEESGRYAVALDAAVESEAVTVALKPVKLAVEF